MALFFIFYQVTAYSLTSFTCALLFCTLTFLILKKIYGRFFKAVQKLFDEIGILKAIFMKRPLLQTSIFLSTEYCLTLWGGSRVVRVVRSNPLTWKKKTFYHVRFLRKKHKWTKQNASLKFVLYKRFFFICLLGKVIISLFTLLAPKVVIFESY